MRSPPPFHLKSFTCIHRRGNKSNAIRRSYPRRRFQKFFSLSFSISLFLLIYTGIYIYMHINYKLLYHPSTSILFEVYFSIRRQKVSAALQRAPGVSCHSLYAHGVVFNPWINRLRPKSTNYFRDGVKKKRGKKRYLKPFSKNWVK